jgi:hypothetical protein
MKRKMTALALLLAGCAKQPDRQATAVNQGSPATTKGTEAAMTSNNAGLVRLPRERAPLTEPKGPIDPKSAEAAGQIVQQYGALIEQSRFDDAEKLWGNPRAAADFAKELRPTTHIQIGDLGETEGAAGSIYTTVPVVLYGDGFHRGANVVLRRVNDVPGSTAEQRHWHIERIEWAN